MALEPRRINVKMKATSALFLHHLSGCRAILAEVAYSHGQDLEQLEMVVSIDSEHKEHLATALRSMEARENQGSLIGRFYRVTGMLTAPTPVGGDTKYVLNALSIDEYHALNNPGSLLRGLPIITGNTIEEIKQQLQDPNVPRVP